MGTTNRGTGTDKDAAAAHTRLLLTAVCYQDGVRLAASHTPPAVALHRQA